LLIIKYFGKLFWEALNKLLQFSSKYSGKQA
jgi:hypothetical protein